jgi:hypothetical protein
VLASGWYVNWWVFGLFAAALLCPIVAVAAGRFRRRPRRVVRVGTLLLAPLLCAGWVVAERSMPGAWLGGSMVPWSAIPNGFVDDERFWGGSYGADPRNQPCRSSEDLAINGIGAIASLDGKRRGPRERVQLPLLLAGHFSGPFGGPNVYEPSGIMKNESPAWYFVEVAKDCFATYGPSGEG